MHRALFATVVLCLALGHTAVAAAQRKPSSSSSSAKAVAAGAQIAALPGIGDKTAKVIIEYRDKNGGFKKIEELMNVKGIGEKSFLKLKSLVTVGDARPAPKQ